MRETWVKLGSRGRQGPGCAGPVGTDIRLFSESITGGAIKGLRQT